MLFYALILLFLLSVFLAESFFLLAHNSRLAESFRYTIPIEEPHPNDYFQDQINHLNIQHCLDKLGSLVHLGLTSLFPHAKTINERFL